MGSSSPLPASRHRGTAGCQHHLYSAPSTVWLWNTSPRSISLSEVRGLPQSHTRVSARARAPIPYFLESSPHSVTGQQTGPVCGDHGPPSHSGRWRGSFFSRPPGAFGGSPDKRVRPTVKVTGDASISTRSPCTSNKVPRCVRSGSSTPPTSIVSEVPDNKSHTKNKDDSQRSVPEGETEGSDSFPAWAIVVVILLSVILLLVFIGLIVLVRESNAQGG